MASGAFIFLVPVLYLGLIFSVAYYGDRRASGGRSVIGSSGIYSLSLAVYCTSWTFYGSVGRAATSGLDFLPIYLGPTLTFCLGAALLQRILRVSKANRITSIADFIAFRFGKSAAVAGLVTVIAVIGSLPYIALQLKAISTSFLVLLHAEGPLPSHALTAATILDDVAFWIAMLLALFSILFGTRAIDASERHEGMVAAIAFESIVKLLCFAAVGLFVSYVLFNGFGDLFGRAAARPELARLLRVGSSGTGFDWLALMLLAMMAIVCLPRQFQVMVVENVDERHLDRALWLFPLYLLAINLFVLPIALAGRLAMPSQSDPDMLVLTLPIAARQHWLALLAYIGGFSAATAMVIVETIALSTMVCNDVIVPALLGMQPDRGDLRGLLLAIRRGAIAIIVLLGFLYMRLVGEGYALVSIGLVSFTAAAQFFPAIVLGLFWRRANRIGALAGIGGGSLVWAYTLLLPSFARSGWLFSPDFLADGAFGIAALRPYALLGLTGLDPVTHALFWSMLANVGLLVGASMATQQSVLERSQAALFIEGGRGIALGETLFWRGTARLPELAALLSRFLGEERSREIFATYAEEHHLDRQTPTADPRLIRHAERLLAGAIGSASARVMIASVVEEEPLGLDEVMRMLDETSQLIAYSHRLEEKSRALEETTAELRQANERLKELDRLKDDFVSTVSHELRTPLTSIRSFSEILHANPDLDPARRSEFLGIIVKESERLTRLINEMLDLAKIESGTIDWTMSAVDIGDVAREAAASLSQLSRDKNIALDLSLSHDAAEAWADRDRLMQVIVNLLANAVKFSPRDTGRVMLAVTGDQGSVTLTVSDNGPGIPPEQHLSIFDRFRQGGDTLTAKPQGTGLGLAISRMIIEHFGGRIWVQGEAGGGAVFHVRLPRHRALAEAS